MQEKHLYEYAVIRVLPKVEREEFMNVGIIMFSKRAKYIRMQYHVNENKLHCFSNELDLQLICDTLQSFQKIASGTKDSGKIGTMEIPERFRWITAERSSCIQTSRPHSGFSEDLDKTFEKLFDELVL
ncbi:DUF3037 domain-containing protein [Bacteroidales bacterium OttesenSCG-928-C19]|nr:DUF3037 domain-containing protein [Bacteroidales bacterium OttesenSCG-928-C19]